LCLPKFNKFETAAGFYKGAGLAISGFTQDAREWQPVGGVGFGITMDMGWMIYSTA
jgi:hypothetical protein